jgi:hypothetical protein
MENYVSFGFFARIGAKGAILKSISRSRSRPWASAHTDLGGGLSPPPPKTPRALSLRAVAGTTDVFRGYSKWRKSRCFALPSLGVTRPAASPFGPSLRDVVSQSSTRATGLEAAPFS